MPRSMRIDAEVWKTAIAKAEVEGTTVTALVEAFLCQYIKDGEPE